MDQKREEYHLAIREHLRSSYLLTEEKIEAVMPRFLKTISTLMSELEQLTVTGESEAICRAGHAMKGALLNLGLHGLAQKAFQIEKHQETDINDSCEQLVDELKQEIAKII
jgi:HPt (histidine-containing phosphotransfer) domain-containing protein